MFRATPAIVAAFVLAPVAFATHPSWMDERKVNLDGDRALERIVAGYAVSSDHKFERADMAAFDRCGGRERRYELAAPGRWVGGILSRKALGRSAVAFSMGYRDGHVIARVIQLRAKREGWWSLGACPTPASLLAYSSKSPPYPAPPGYDIAVAQFAAGEHSSAYPGKELVLTEDYSSPRMNPSRKLRRTYFGYSTAKRRYVAYRTDLSPA
jgi:hypothetical protein